MKAFLIRATGGGETDAIVAALHELGTAGIEERADALLAYFADEGTSLDVIRAALPDASVLETPVPDVDWVARFRENFRGFAVGGFWIAPVWDRGPAPPGARALVVDPGRAFGTGTHESTALCLLALEDLAAGGPLGHVVDVGTGSGILAVAARMLGASSVTAADLDPESIDSAREHARLNAAAVVVIRADGGRALRSARFDTVVANITAPLLIARASELGALVAPRGRLVLAGLLVPEMADVRAAYSTFPTAGESVRGEWGSLILERS